MESLFGPLSTQALASQIFGLYSGFVYFTPMFGGIIADRWIGQRNGVVIGALSMSAGHIAMTFDQSFLLALSLLVIGSGFLKGNISAQVGALYPREDEARRSHGFVIFSTAINIGSVAGPLLCGLPAQVFGWHYGFGIAAIFMLLGLATYLYGYRYLPARVERRSFEGTRLTAADRRVVPGFNRSGHSCTAPGSGSPSSTMARVARTRFARGAGQGERHADGAGLHEPVRFEQPDRLDRRLLRKDGAGRVLGDACRHRRRRRPIGPAVRASPRPGSPTGMMFAGDALRWGLFAGRPSAPNRVAAAQR